MHLVKDKCTNDMLPLVIAWCFHSNSQFKRDFYFIFFPKVSFIFLSIVCRLLWTPDPGAASCLNQIWPCLSSEMVSLLYQIPRSDCLHRKISNKISLSCCLWVGTFARLFSEVKRMSVILVNSIFSLSAVKYWVLSYRAIIVMLHVWQWNWYELKSPGYIFEYFSSWLNCT